MAEIQILKYSRVIIAASKSHQPLWMRKWTCGISFPREETDALISLTVMVISRVYVYENIHLCPVKYTQFLFVLYTAVKLGKRRKWIFFVCCLSISNISISLLTGDVLICPSLPERYESVRFQRGIQLPSPCEVARA